MSQDITFCANADCKNKKCFRHQSNIINPRIPHSFAWFTGTPDCPMRVEMTDEQAIEHLRELKTLKIEFPNVLQEEALDLAIKALEFKIKYDKEQAKMLDDWSKEY